MTVQSPPPPQQAPAKKKGMGVVGWLAIGCLIVLLLGLGSCFACGYYAKRKLGQISQDFEKNPEMATAKMVVQMTPDLELVSTDDAAGTLTVKNTKTGEVVTVSVADAKEGKFSISTDQGTSSVDVNQDGSMEVTGADGQTATLSTGGTADLPSWVPAYPNGQASTNYTATTNEGKTAMVMVTTSDSIDDVASFYEQRLKEGGLEVSKSVSNVGGETIATVGASDPKRQVSIMVASVDGKTQATVTWTEKP